MIKLEEMGQRAKKAAQAVAQAGAQKDAALRSMAQALRDHTKELLEANCQDLEAARRAGMKKSLLDRLALTEERVSSMAGGILEVAAQQDPIGEVVSGGVRPNGLRIEQVRVPLGVIGIIYEARPNVTADAAALCLKAGSAVILRGGKEAIASNTAISEVLRNAAGEAGLPADAIQLVTDTARDSATAMMNLTGYLDVLIPRGGKGLIQSVVQNSHVPVIQTGEGNCHVYIDESADPTQAAEIVCNAKTSRPSVCNAIETVLIHQGAAARVLPVMWESLREKKVELRGCPRTREILGECVVPATEQDWETEFLDLILAVRVVDSLDEALEHIKRYSTGHSECIVTQSYQNAERFAACVDSAAVYINASTRFTDGGEFGLGAEIGISTQKLHARGPMGIRQLTSTKFILRGNGQVR